MRSAILASLMFGVILASTANAGLTGRITHPGCPTLACKTVIDVAATGLAQGGSQGEKKALFLAVYPDGPESAVGGFWNGRDWVVGQVPVPFHLGEASTVRRRVVVEGGLCKKIAQEGGPSGDYKVLLGVGSQVNRAEDPAELENMRRAAEAYPDDQELQELLAEFEAATARLAERQGQGVAAAQDMINRGAYVQIGRVSCS